MADESYDDVGVFKTYAAYPEFDLDSATKVYRRGRSDTFHADDRCPHLLAAATKDHGGLTDHERVVCVDVLSLAQVMSSYIDPVKACTHCTLPIRDCARIAVAKDGLSARRLSVFERGDRRYRTRSRVVGDSEVVTSTSVEVIE